MKSICERTLKLWRLSQLLFVSHVVILYNASVFYFLFNHRVKKVTSIRRFFSTLSVSLVVLLENVGHIWFNLDLRILSCTRHEHRIWLRAHMTRLTHHLIQTRPLAYRASLSVLVLFLWTRVHCKVLWWSQERFALALNHVRHTLIRLPSWRSEPIYLYHLGHL